LGACFITTILETRWSRELNSIKPTEWRSEPFWEFYRDTYQGNVVSLLCDNAVHNSDLTGPFLIRVVTHDDSDYAFLFVRGKEKSQGYYVDCWRKPGAFQES
jgi:hypothetical protein